jgi:hypothetical protein
LQKYLPGKLIPCQQAENGRLFFFTTKITKDTKDSDIWDSKLRALPVLRGEYSAGTPHEIQVSTVKGFSKEDNRLNQIASVFHSMVVGLYGY